MTTDAPTEAEVYTNDTKRNSFCFRTSKIPMNKIAHLVADLIIGGDENNK